MFPPVAAEPVHPAAMAANPELLSFLDQVSSHLFADAFHVGLCRLPQECVAGGASFHDWLCIQRVMPHELADLLLYIVRPNKDRRHAGLYRTFHQHPVTCQQHSVFRTGKVDQPGIFVAVCRQSSALLVS